MTVSELIAELQKMPGDAEVVFLKELETKESPVNNNVLEIQCERLTIIAGYPANGQEGNGDVFMGIKHDGYMTVSAIKQWVTNGSKTNR